MLVTASAELRSFVRTHGGTAWVSCRGTAGLRWVTLLETRMRAPRSEVGFDLFVVDDILVATRLPVHLRPHELHLAMEGRRRRRPVTTWDGCVFII